MNFSENFKKWWWAILTLVTVVFLALSCRLLSIGDLKYFFIVLLVILVMLPLINEISFMGMSVKKEIEKVREEFKSSIVELKNQITNNSQQTVNEININNPATASAKEYEVKAKEEFKEEESIEKVPPIIKEVNDKPQQKNPRFEKMLKLEKTVVEYLLKSANLDFKPQVKFAYGRESGNEIILDGVILNKGQVKEIVEIKYIASTNFDAFYFTASRFIAKLAKVGIKIPIRFIVLSEHLDEKIGQLIHKQIDEINYNNRAHDLTIPYASIQLFKVEGEGHLSEIKNVN